MEQIEIVIPSHKRADRVTTKKVVANPIICVADSQYLEYKKHNPDCQIVAHPDTVIGLPPKLEWIRQNFGSVFFIDDDVKAFQRTYSKTDMKVTDKHLVREIIEATATACRQSGSYLFGFNKNANPVAYPSLQPIQLTGFVLGGACGLLSGSKLHWDCNMLINGDFFISLLNAYYHRTVYIDNRFAFAFEKTFKNTGGLQEIRNTERLEWHYNYLKKKFGDIIHLKNPNPQRQLAHKWEMTIDLPF